jgi:hypothetical protein
MVEGMITPCKTDITRDAGISAVPSPTRNFSWGVR